MSDTAKKYSVSVGIPTKNRKEKIVNCLKALKNQTFKDFNVIIVDGSEDDETKKICLEHSNSMDIIYIKHLEPGLAKARKVIAENCHSETLLYIDDDVYLLKDCISKLFGRYKNLKNRDNYIMSGQIKYFGNLTAPFKMTAQGSGLSAPVADADYFIGALMFIPKIIYKNIPWNGRFVSWGFEEVFYFLMCKRHGVKLLWINSLMGIHDSEEHENRLVIGTETNRVYTMLYKHIFVEPSISNLLILESAGFLRNLIINSIAYVFSPKKLLFFIFSYVHSWTKGHQWFVKDLSILSGPSNGMPKTC